ncbi:MAG: PQQ-binding-like beta-propeller repeat protein [Planctomycetia bacterium]|nr:PQQ-binding-like beta-propeller repeat protein [Planctomycetia bacterium]
MIRRAIFLSVSLVACGLLTGANWPQFRGQDSSGVAADTNVPTTISDNIAWSAELPGRGLSGPIVVGDKVFLTASSGYQQDRLHLLCFDVATGKKVWERQFWATGRTLCHPKMCNATPTPASDGKRVFGFFSSNDVICLDLDGNLQWMRGMTHDYPNASNSLGMSSSLAVAGDTLIVPVENLSESFTAGLDPATGINRWKLERPQLDTWCSPTVLRGKTADDDLVVLQSSKGLAAVKPYTGFEAWRYDTPASSIPSTAQSNGLLYVPSGGLTALEPAEGGKPPRVVWQSNRLAPSTPTPLVDDGRVYNINGSGVLACADAKSANMLWQLRLQVQLGEKTTRGVFTSTPVAAGGHLYIFNEDGVALVVKEGDAAGEIVANHEFGETILCTPAIADGALYVRSDKHLWKVAKKKG